MAEASARRSTKKTAAKAQPSDADTSSPRSAPSALPTNLPTRQPPTVTSRPLRSGPGAPPLYQQLISDLRTRIRSGELAPGATLDTEQAMRETYGVSIATVRQALQVLTGEGLIAKKHGHPTKVIGSKDDSEKVVDVDLPTATLPLAWRNWDTDWTGPNLLLMGSATTRYAAPLNIAALDDVFLLVRHLDHHTGIRAVHRLVIPAGTLADLPAQNDNELPDTTSLFQLLHQAGHQLDWHTTVATEPPSLSEAAELSIPDGQSILVHQRITLADGLPVALEETRLPGNRVRINLD